MSMSMSGDITRAYRHLYRQGLRAVKFSKPARYVLRDRLREQFRKGHPSDFNQSRINNTLEFLENAAREKGLEHRIVKNLCFIWFHQPSSRTPSTFPRPYLRRDDLGIKSAAYDHLNHTIYMLNETMGMCLPVKNAVPISR